MDEEDAETEGPGQYVAVGSYGTSPEGIAGYLNSHKPLGPGEFDPYIDVYAVKSSDGKSAFLSDTHDFGFMGYFSH